MKKYLFALIVLISTSSISTGQSSRKSNSSSNNPRSERKMAITSEGGFKTMSGTGINFTYYALPQLALDAGAGISFQGLRTGARVRYLFLSENLSPIIGVGINLSNGTLDQTFEQTIEPFEIDGEMFEGFDADVNIKLRRTVAAQLLTGVEYMSDSGFIAALHLGYRHRLNKSWDTEFSIDGQTFDIADDIINSLDRVFGSGLSIAINLGYAF